MKSWYRKFNASVLASVFLSLTLIGLVGSSFAYLSLGYCLYCESAYGIADRKHTAMQETKGSAEYWEEIINNCKEDVEYCYTNHGGATSGYSTHKSAGDLANTQGDTQMGWGDTDYNDGCGQMNSGVTDCENSTPVGSSCYSACIHFNAGYSEFNQADNHYGLAIDCYETAEEDYAQAAEHLNKETEQGCDCDFSWAEPFYEHE